MPVVMVWPCSGPRMNSGLRKSFQTHRPRKIPTVAVAGRTSGMTICPPDAQIGCPVDAGRLDELARHRAKEADVDEHGEREVAAADVGQDQAGVSVVQADCRSSSTIGSSTTCGGTISPSAKTPEAATLDRGALLRDPEAQAQTPAGSGSPSVRPVTTTEFISPACTSWSASISAVMRLSRVNGAGRASGLARICSWRLERARQGDVDRQDEGERDEPGTDEVPTLVDDLRRANVPVSGARGFAPSRPRGSGRVHSYASRRRSRPTCHRRSVRQSEQQIAIADGVAEAVARERDVIR